MLLDGWGYRKEKKYNAIAGNAPFMDYLWQTYPHALFEASGEAVGLPKGNIGTSEIGHLTAGAGRIMYTDMVKIAKAITDGSFAKNQVFLELFDHVKKYNSTLHVMGLMSPGGVHSHQEHIFAFLQLAKQSGIQKLAFHVFSDGRDKPPMSGSVYVKELEEVLQKTVGQIATLSGRYYAMDRDKNWDRIQKATEAMFAGKGIVVTNQTPSKVLEDEYKKNTGDEFVMPHVFTDENGNTTTIQNNDGIFFFNFRPDRAREITAKLLEKEQEMNLYIATMTEYDKNLKTHVAFPQIPMNETLADVISEHNLTQAHIAETEKYAHVTYFFNGMKEEKHTGETWVLIDSRKDVPTHDLAPEMRAKEIIDKTIEYIQKGTHFIVINLANADMVGHTGKWEPTCAAVKCEDTQIERAVKAISEAGGVAIITADHGNAEIMFDETTNQPVTAHTLSPIPFIVTDKNLTLKPEGTLANVAPTILKLLGIEKPPEMTAESMY